MFFEAALGICDEPVAGTICVTAFRCVSRTDLLPRRYDAFKDALTFLALFQHGTAE
jgi:hypothetical protein